jgi:hypothetical protein
MPNNPVTKAPARAHEPQLEPFAVRPKIAAQLAGCCITELYKRLNNNEYESFLDGAARLITVRSIRARHERLAANQPKTSKHPGRPGRPKGSKNKKKTASS